MGARHNGRHEERHAAAHGARRASNRAAARVSDSRIRQRGAAHAAVLPRKRHTARNIILTVFILLLAAAAAAGYAGFRLYQSAMSAKTHLNNVVATAKSLSSGDTTEALSKIGTSVDTIQREAAAAKSDTTGFLWDWAEKVPVYGNDVKTVRSAIDTLNDFSQTTLPQLKTASDTLLNAKLSDGKGGLNTEPIITAAKQLTAANNSLKAQVKEFNALPNAKIGMIQSALGKGKTQLAKVSDKVDELTGMVNMMPGFLGANGSRNYVILAQTNSEIRSSGGLIGSVGSFKADQGKITMGEFHSNLEFHGSATDQIGENEASLYNGLYFGTVIHNISTSPDFPQVARMASEFWKQQSFGGDSDGVLSLDPVALQAMIGATGPVTLSDGRVLDGTNTADFLLNGAYIELSVDEQNTYFAETAAQVVANMFKDMNSKKLMTLAKAMMSMAEQRHFYFWSFHDDDLPALRDANMTGEITDDKAQPVTGLYLNEMQASKMDYYIQRQSVVKKVAANADGTTTWHVTTTFTNTLKAADAPSLPEYIIANTQNGTAMNLVTIFAPTGGSVSNVSASTEGVPTGTAFAQTSVYQHDVMYGTLSFAPESTVTLEWDVTTAAGSGSLKLDQTPTANTKNSVTYKN
ncbi:DUF4012 domain-containing protein [Bifidobacterium jacchi]|uniref:DUF4012 domain-containing protein n=1 Tax=Bifidobacterium jacchi TaxID=2490545 RepID=A0A5N5RE68_9BIFI|nr:DUF4012 domain-containing protein [Bifidobacterium jacchi]KAB5605533.1 DUF4012 domain-containing protein [Bifidobacterium jacchi]